MDHIVTRIFICIMFAMWMSAAYLGYNEARLADTYDGRTKLRALVTALLLGGLCILVFLIPSD